MQQVIHAENHVECIATGLVNDPLAEEVFDDMDPDDKMEFPEVRQELQRRRVRERMADLQRKRKLPPLRRAVKRRRQAGAAAPPPAPGEDDLPPPAPEALPLAGSGEAPLPLPPAFAGGEPAPLPPWPPEGGGEEPLPLPPAVQQRAPAVRVLVWETFPCAVCGVDVGQIKFDPMPGARDGASWVMRVWDQAAARWPLQGPLFRTRRTSIVGDNMDFALAWVQTNRQCGCPQ